MIYKIQLNDVLVTSNCEISEEEGFKQWHYRFKELIKQDLNGKDIYISMNTFYKTYRRIDCLKELRACYIDLDIYNTKFTKEQVIMNLEENYYNQSIPIPNFVMDSGRGLYLIWLINTVPSKALPLWKAIEEYLYKELKDFGADRKALDPTRILRVEGSINSKSNTMVKILDENIDAHTLFERAIRQCMMIRDCSTFAGLEERFIRFCIMKPEDNTRLINCLTQ